MPLYTYEHPETSETIDIVEESITEALIEGC